MIYTENQRIESADGHPIRLSVTRPRENARYAVVLAHGIFTNSSENGALDELARRIADEGMVALQFDFRGHGESGWSSRQFTPLGAVRDLRAVAAWCSLNSLQVSFVGSSFGGSSVLNLLAAGGIGNEVLSVLLLNPVLDYRKTFIEPSTDWGKGLFSEARQEAIRSNGFARLTPHFIASVNLLDQLTMIRPYEALGASDIPTLVVHGDCDDKVPVEISRSCATEAPSVKYHEISGAGHGFGDDFVRTIIPLAIRWLKENS